MTVTSALTSTPPPRPELTMPEAEAALLRAEYGRAQTILEYGSGGSTLVAAEMPGKYVISVESDRAWVAMMQDWFAANPPAPETEINVLWCDIGPTADWGYPADESGWRSYPNYPLQVWRRGDFRHPDVVLVDGRFRQGCALAAAFQCTRPLVLLFDDYVPRKHYHVVEDYLGQPRITGRMARFEITPRPIPPDRLLQIIKLMSRP